jgi:type II secretory pathway pseudopilin PulG
MADYPTPPPVPNAAPSKMSGLAIASLVLGILGICGGLTAILGLILGIFALAKIRDSRGTLAGQGIALAGIIVSAVALIMIPIFAAMLLPALAAAKQRAQLINSVNNEKQLALAIRIYAGDHTNQLPPAVTWCDAINSTVGQPSFFVRPGSDPGSRCGYAFNAALGDLDESKVDPRTVMLFESDAGWNANGGADIMLTSGYGRRAHVAAVAFADGSVQILPQSQLSTLRWNP